jgi:hypothetical protein
MADFTTTTNLSLKKPAIGGSSDKWGEYLNENLETIGTSIVNLQNASTSRSLESLSNVLDTTPTTGQLLQYDTANWKAATVTIPDNIQDLSNVTISSPDDGQVLAWSNSNSSWENQTPGAATIPDGTITTAKLSTSLQGQVALILQTTGTPTDNQILRYNSTSTNWEFENLPGGTVSALSDTDVSAIANKDVLVYNSTSGDWVSRPLAIADVTNLQTSLDAKLESSDISVSALSDTTITSTADDSFLVYDSSDSKWKNEGPSTVRSTLGLVIGTNVQAYDADLTTLGGLAQTDGNFIVGNGTTWTVESGATARTSLGLGTLATQSTITESQISDLQSYLTAETNDLSAAVTWANVPDANITQSSVTQHEAALTITESQISDLGSYQPSDAGLTSISGLTTAADQMIYTTASDTYSVTTLTTAGRALLDDADASAQRTTLGLGSAATSNTSAFESAGSVSTHAALTEVHGISAFGATLVDDADAAAARTTLNVDVSGTDNSTPVSLITTAHDYLSLSSQAITLGPIDMTADVSGTLPVANGGTGVTALSSLNAADLGSNNGVTDATDGYVLTADGTGGVAWEAATGGSGINNVVEDLSPQLGGNLDVNGQSIVSVSAGNIAITPDTTGKIILDGLSWPTADGSADQVLKTDGAGNLSFVDQSGGGGSGTSYIQHSSTVSDSLAISSGTNRMYIGNTAFSGSGTMGGYLVISHGYANFTGTVNVDTTGTLNVVS